MRLQILEDMDEKLKKIDLFNGQIKEFNVFMKELEDWLPQGRKRMDDLLSPDNPIKAEDRVVQTMELQVSFLILTNRGRGACVWAAAGARTRGGWRESPSWARRSSC